MIRLTWDSDNMDGDLVVNSTTGTDITHELETAVIISLFCDARADVGDDVPEGDRRGWWAVAFFDNVTKWGSKLWQFLTGKATNSTLKGARQACLRALQWMIDDGVAQNVEVDTWWIADRKGYMGILVRVYRPDNPAPQYIGPWERYYGVA